MKNNFFYLFIVILFASCAKRTVYTQDQFSKNSPSNLFDGKLLEEVYLIGDVGADSSKSKYALNLLHNHLNKSEDSSTSVIFLGDNIYPKGLHKKDHYLRPQDEININAQLKSVEGFDGEIVFIPGNHDWEQGGENGFENVKRQEDYIQDALDKKAFRPSDGCAGPDDIEISDNLTLILIDTQWWLHKHEKGRGEKDDCNVSTKEEFLIEFKDLLKKNRDKNVVVAGHHPLFSNGRHGGYFVANDFLFPLRNINKNYILPLPLVGIVYPFYRSIFGNIQDIPNPIYQEMKNSLVAVMNEFDNVVYAAGHEHNLQYFKEERTHHVVSGSGAKLSPVRFNYRVDFAAVHKGFAKLEYYESGAVYLKYFAGDISTGEDSILFSSKIYTKKVKTFKEKKDVPKKSYKGMYATVVPDSSYKAGRIKKFFFGELNREIWATPIKVPYLDIHYEKGGLTPVEKGGGQQTVSLKLKAKDGKEYKVRGVKKSAEYLVSRDLRGTIAQDIIYDGIAGSHPYASVVIPEMAKAANIYYTNPKLVYIPKDSILGDYGEEFGGMLAMFEIHPDDDMSDLPEFGNSKEVLNYSKAIEELEQHQDHIVDVDFAVRSRVFDMLLGDWDRHDDQWRWATFKEGDKTIYRPIPRDRDQVFFKFDGVVMNIANRKWLIRKFQPFKEDVRDILGLNFNARFFDRYFLVEADEEAWLKAAEFIQQNVTDEIIEEALKQLPKEAYAINGDELVEILKARRANLLEFTKRYYKVLSEDVNIVGTDDEDYFEVIRMENGDVEVNVYPRKDGKKVQEKQFYHRVFKKDETKEIRLYGMSDDDEYKIKGETNKSILVRIIAGPDKDKIEDKSTVRGINKKTLVYEVKNEDFKEVESEGETKVKAFEPGSEYFLDRRAYLFSKSIPLPSIGFNQDDGFYIGPGVIIFTQGFQKRPYKSMHKLFANYATKAEGYNFSYENNYIDLFGDYDFGAKFDLNKPLVYQFYGLGNETTPPDENIGNSQVRLENIKLKARFARSNQLQSKKLYSDLSYQLIDLDSAVAFDINSINKSEQFAALNIGYAYNNTESKINPQRGLKYSLDIGKTFSTTSGDYDFFDVDAEMAIYFPFYNFRKQTTLAVRTGYSANFGDFEFYHAKFLSGLNNLRGIGRNRFAGESVFFSNFEFRKSLTKVDNYVVPFDLGFFVHTDLGRVWVDNESSDKWHNSFGGGVFFNVLDFFGLTATYSVSDVDQQFLFGTNLYF